jgi:nitrogen fixation NifU-like protein
MDGDRIESVKFEGMGCAISKASASVMTTLVKGKTREEARAMFGQFQQMVTGQGTGAGSGAGGRKLAVFSGVCEFPSRVKCAILGWHALRAAIEDRATAPVSTE